MHLLKIPRLGQTMERGVVVEWLVEPGADYETGDELYELETEKNTSVVEAKAPGTLRSVVGETGVELPVGTVIAVVADPGETLDDDDVAAALADSTPSRASGSSAPESPPPSELASSGTTTGQPTTGRIAAVPKARARAKDLGIDLASVTGTGSGGTVTVEDVERIAANGSEGATDGVAGVADPAGADGVAAVRERRAVAGIGRAMAESMTRSWTQIPQFVQQVSVDATALLARRAELAAAGTPVSLTALFVRAVADAAVEVPEANATFAGQEIVLYSDVNVGVAVAGDAGLVVPVVHRAQDLALDVVATRVADVAARGRTRALGPDDTGGATITLSNLGGSGVHSGTPLITPPQTAIVFAGAIVDTPVAVDGRVEVRPILGLANAFDHRVLDGATAARFTRRLVEALEARLPEGQPSHAT